MKTRSFRPLVPALVLIGFALVMGAIAAGYPQGSLLRPGPGFFPLSIAVLLAGLGLTVGAEAWRGGAAPTEGRFAWRPLLSTVTAMLAFALLLERRVSCPPRWP